MAKIGWSTREQGDMGTNDRLREAADALRERAEGATPSHGWRAHTFTAKHKLVLGGGSKTVEHAFLPGLVDDDGVYGGLFNPQDARLIEVMHPGVALALIEWMDAAADEEGSFPEAHPAVVMADAILEVADRG